MAVEKSELHQDLEALKIDRSGPLATTPHAPKPFVNGLWVWVAGGGALFLVIMGIWLFPKSSPQVIQVETLPIPPQNPSGTLLTANGYIISKNRAALGFGRSGKIQSILVEEGQHVLRGQKLAVLENLEITARLEEARRDFERKETLYGDQLISEKEFEDAQTRLKVAQSQWQDTVILAPFSGDVVQKLAEVGETVSALGAPGTDAQGIIVLADRKNLDVEVDINETSLALVSKGTPAEITADAFPDRTYHGKLIEIRPSADRAKATVRVKVRIEDPDDKLLPDMGARVAFLRPVKIRGGN